MKTNKEFKKTWYWLETLDTGDTKLRFMEPQPCKTTGCRTFHYSFTKPEVQEKGYAGLCVNCNKYMIIPFRKAEEQSTINYQEIYMHEW